MNAPVFDTLKFANRLKAAGVTPEQAEAQAQAIVEAVGASDLATKADVRDLRADMNTRFTEVKGELTLVEWMLGVTATGLIAILLRLFLHA